MLNERAGQRPRVEIIKAGQGRYFPEPERTMLEYYGQKYAPDLVLVGFLVNDIVDTHLGLDAVRIHKSSYLISREAAKLGDLGCWLFIHSHVFRALTHRLIPPPNSEPELPSWLDRHQEGGAHEADWQAVERAFERMAGLAQGIGAKLVIFRISEIGPWEAYHDNPSERLSRWASGHEAVFFDILPAMKVAAQKEVLYYKIDTHCTPAATGSSPKLLLEILSPPVSCHKLQDRTSLYRRLQCQFDRGKKVKTDLFTRANCATCCNIYCPVLAVPSQLCS
jgi:hypothetical protein